MVKVNLIIDGSYLLYKNVFILKKLRSLHDLEDLLERDLITLSKSFMFDNVYFASDSPEKNWRKIIYPEYKGKRKKDSDIDWEFVYKTYDSFKEKLKQKHNIKFLEYSGLEGDDFIAYIIEKTNQNNYSNIIVGSDGDLQQLLKMDLNKNYINIQWNYRFSDPRLYLPNNYQLFLDKLQNTESYDLFDIEDNNDSDFYNFIINLINKTKSNSVTSEQIIFEKIVQGDISDNIISVIKIKNGVYDEKGMGIGKTGANKVYKLYQEIHPGDIDIDSDIFIKNLTDVVLYYKKIKNPSNEIKNKVMENIIFNRRLIKLDTSYMPEKTYESLDNHFSLIDNVTEVKQINLEEKLTNDGFFDEKVDDIDENFRKDEKPSENFDLDDFWEL